MLYCLAYDLDSNVLGPCFANKDFWSNALSGIGLSLFAGAIISFLIDLPNTLKNYKQSIIDTLTSNDYLATLEPDKLEILRKDVTVALYSNTKDAETGLVELDQQICSLLQQPYYTYYRQTVKCIYDDKLPFIEKDIYVEYELKNPNSQIPVREDIGLRINTESLSASGVAFDAMLEVKSIEYQKDGVEPKVDNKVHVFPEMGSDGIKVCLLMSQDKSSYIPFNVEFRDLLVVKITYTSRIPKKDVIFTKRLRHPAKSFILNYWVNERSFKRLHGELIGTLMGGNDYSLTGNETSSIVIESKKWLLPKNGAVVMIL